MVEVSLDLVSREQIEVAVEKAETFSQCVGRKDDQGI